MARFLAEYGPIWGDAAAEALGLSLDAWWDAVNQCRWFTFTQKGWRLTDRGRAEGLGETK